MLFFPSLESVKEHTKHTPTPAHIQMHTHTHRVGIVGVLCIRVGELGIRRRAMAKIKNFSLHVRLLGCSVPQTTRGRMTLNQENKFFRVLKKKTSTTREAKLSVVSHFCSHIGWTPKREQPSSLLSQHTMTRAGSCCLTKHLHKHPPSTQTHTHTSSTRTINDLVRV